MSSQALLETALSLAGEPGGQFLELARTLHRLHEVDLSAFQGFIQKSKISHRKALYLADIGRTFGNRRISAARLQRIGWTNLKEIEPHVTDKNLEKLLKAAETLSTRELLAFVHDDDGAPRSHCVQFHLNDREYRDLREALLSHGGKPSSRGISGKERALMRLVRKAKALTII
jgi:hypothetical protein